MRLLIGRAHNRAQFAIPHDIHVRVHHFAVGCGPNGCRVIDRAAPRTQLNGAKIQESMLAIRRQKSSPANRFFVVRHCLLTDQLPAASSWLHRLPPTAGPQLQ